ncbi:DUF2891 domain-containing protein [Halovivax limisalsi]|uniref:DUF2891 domain-containing protein n=1 Tax=Halovivax limisalsi TaxID=1453760 RepID=UPI001FFD4915|nr:DUF2891 domain-containing protein [Halovivax limisalsi]
MHPFEGVDTAIVVEGRSDWVRSELADRFAEAPLSGVEREYPHHVGAIDGPDDVPRPAEDHPVFYGCYDWHSAVHGHWALVRGLRLFDDHPRDAEIVESLDARLTPENVERERAYLEDNPTFEEPYGWGWFLRLAAELHLWVESGPDERPDAWLETLRPLEETVVELVESRLLPSERPQRVGTHGNTAFALSCVLDYARVRGESDLERAVVDATARLYGDDRDYPIEYEPLGWDFLSPALVEADLVRRVLDFASFADWFDEFLPDVARSPAEALPDPIAVDPDVDDGMTLHLAGLDLSRAWCLAGIAETLGDRPAAAAMERSAREHADAGLSVAFTDTYAGSHWLASFALYLVTRRDGAIAPP